MYEIIPLTLPNLDHMYHESSLLQKILSQQKHLRDLVNLSVNWLLELTKSIMAKLNGSIWCRCAKIVEKLTEHIGGWPRVRQQGGNQRRVDCWVALG